MFCRVLLLKLLFLVAVYTHQEEYSENDDSKIFESTLYNDEEEGKEYSDIWAVELAEGADPDHVARVNGFRNKGPINEKRFYEFVYAGPSTHLEKRTSSRHVQRIHRQLTDHPHVKWFERQTILERVKRSLAFNDPQIEYEWYIRNTGKHNSGLRGFDLNVWAVWELGYTGKGVKVSVLDDGLGKYSITHFQCCNNFSKSYQHVHCLPRKIILGML
jgi:subtilisin family serine protease